MFMLSLAVLASSMIGQTATPRVPTWQHAFHADDAFAGFDPEPVTLGSSAVTAQPLAIESADLDGDGDLDLVSANRSSDSLTVFFQHSPGRFSNQPLILGNSSTTRNPQGVAAADLDGDGDLDLVSCNNGADTLTIFWQESGGVFDPVPLVIGPFDATSNLQDVDAADLDGDGDLDLLVADASGSLLICWQAAPREFDAVPTVLFTGGLNDSPQNAGAADLDGDGELDVFSANYKGASSATVFWQVGQGAYDPIPLVLTAPQMHGTKDIEAADLDGDGDLDLVTANASFNTLTIFDQVAPGSFHFQQSVVGMPAGFDAPLEVDVADIDADGRLDLITSNLDSSSLSVFLQLRPGVFDLRPLTVGEWYQTSEPWDMEVADLDGDGDLDLVSVNTGILFFVPGNTLTIFFNQLVP